MSPETRQRTAIGAEDRALIAELIARYAWALDTDTPDAVAALFTEEGVFDGVSGMFEGRERVRAMASVSRSHDGPLLVQHWVGNSVFDGDAERCVVRSMCIGPAADGSASTLAFVGTYVDVCVKVEGSWLFARRRWRPWDGRPLP